MKLIRPKGRDQIVAALIEKRKLAEAETKKGLQRFDEMSKHIVVKFQATEAEIKAIYLEYNALDLYEADHNSEREITKEIDGKFMEKLSKVDDMRIYHNILFLKEAEDRLLCVRAGIAALEILGADSETQTSEQ